MKKIALHYFYQYMTLGILIATIATVFILGLYTYQNISETITTAARLIELRPEIAVTEQLNVAVWVKIKERVSEKVEMHGSSEVTIIRDPFAP